MRHAGVHEATMWEPQNMGGMLGGSHTTPCPDKTTRDPSQMGQTWHTAYIASAGGRASAPCHHCRGIDHSASTYALAQVVSPVRSASQERPTSQSRWLSTPICRSWNFGKHRFPGTCYYRHIPAPTVGRSTRQMTAERTLRTT